MKFCWWMASKDTQTISEFEHVVQQDSYNPGNVTLNWNLLLETPNEKGSINQLDHAAQQDN